MLRTVRCLVVHSKRHACCTWYSLCSSFPLALFSDGFVPIIMQDKLFGLVLGALMLFMPVQSVLPITCEETLQCYEHARLVGNDDLASFETYVVPRKMEWCSQYIGSHSSMLALSKCSVSIFGFCRSLETNAEELSENRNELSIIFRDYIQNYTAEVEATCQEEHLDTYNENSCHMGKTCLNASSDLIQQHYESYVGGTMTTEEEEQYCNQFDSDNHSLFSTVAYCFPSIFACNDTLDADLPVNSTELQLEYADLVYQVSVNISETCPDELSTKVYCEEVSRCLQNSTQFAREQFENYDMMTAQQKNDFCNASSANYGIGMLDKLNKCLMLIMECAVSDSREQLQWEYDRQQEGYDVLLHKKCFLGDAEPCEFAFSCFDNATGFIDQEIHHFLILDAQRKKDYCFTMASNSSSHALFLTFDMLINCTRIATYCEDKNSTDDLAVRHKTMLQKISMEITLMNAQCSLVNFYGTDGDYDKGFQRPADDYDDYNYWQLDDDSDWQLGDDDNGWQLGDNDWQLDDDDWLLGDDSDWQSGADTGGCEQARKCFEGMKATIIEEVNRMHLRSEEELEEFCRTLFAENNHDGPPDHPMFAQIVNCSLMAIFCPQIMEGLETEFETIFMDVAAKCPPSSFPSDSDDYPSNYDGAHVDGNSPCLIQMSRCAGHFTGEVAPLIEGGLDNLLMAVNSVSSYCKILKEHHLEAMFSEMAFCMYEAAVRCHHHQSPNLDDLYVHLKDIQCVEECDNAEEKMEAVEGCLPHDAITEMEAYADDPTRSRTTEKYKETVDKVCKALVGNETLTACVEEISICCFQVQFMVQESLDGFIHEFPEIPQTCPEIRHIISGVCEKESKATNDSYNDNSTSSTDKIGQAAFQKDFAAKVAVSFVVLLPTQIMVLLAFFLAL